MTLIPDSDMDPAWDFGFSALHLTESDLNEQESSAFSDRLKKIDTLDSLGILQYGVGTQKRIAAFSDGILSHISARSLSEIAALLTKLFDLFEGLRVEAFQTPIKKRFSFLHRQTGCSPATKNARKEIRTLGELLEAHRIRLLKQIILLDKFCQRNQSCFYELSFSLLVCKEKLKQLSSNQPSSQDPFSVELCSRQKIFEKRLQDLELTRITTLQILPQIILIQKNDCTLCETIRFVLEKLIPASLKIGTDITIDFLSSDSLDSVSAIANKKRERAQAESELIQIHTALVRLSSVTHP